MQSGSKGYGLYLKNFCVELWESNKKRSLQYLRTSCSARETFVTAHEKPSSDGAACVPGSSRGSSAGYILCKYRICRKTRVQYRKITCFGSTECYAERFTDSAPWLRPTNQEAINVEREEREGRTAFI